MANLSFYIQLWKILLDHCDAYYWCVNYILVGLNHLKMIITFCFKGAKVKSSMWCWIWWFLPIFAKKVPNAHFRPFSPGWGPKHVLEHFSQVKHNLTLFSSWEVWGTSSIHVLLVFQPNIPMSEAMCLGKTSDKVLTFFSSHQPCTTVARILTVLSCFLAHGEETHLPRHLTSTQLRTFELTVTFITFRNPESHRP